MKTKVLFSVLVLSLGVSGMASAMCFDVLFRACAPRVECSSYCLEENEECNAYNEIEPLRVREDCVEDGSLLESCDDKVTPKEDCKVIYLCVGLGDMMCIPGPGWHCAKATTGVTTVWWITELGDAC